MPVIGTAGHVDHGKSTLVQALTGRDPDRLAEEKARGLTIDLGFAWATLPGGAEVGFVDVPGHERFIKNMLAGIEAVQGVLFVVAADEGWMPQSEEHLAVIDLLDITSGVVAITRTDLVDEDTVALARLEVEERLVGTSLQGSRIVSVSAPAGVGLDELTEALADMVASSPAPDDVGRPRLWVDRSFVIAGSGTVVTGTLTGGRLAVGEQIVLWPGGDLVRIRHIQSHERDRDEVGPGTRTALNLSGLSRDEVTRGSMAGRTGQWQPGDEFLAVLRPVRGGDVVARGAFHLHLGSGWWPADLRILENSTSEALALVRPDAPIPVTMGDRFILRETGRRAVVGGGRIVEPAPHGRPWRRPGTVAALTGSLDETPDDRADALLAARGMAALATLSAHSGGGIPRDALMAADAALSEERAASLATTASTVVAAFHAANPLRAGIPAASLAEQLGVPQGLLTALVEGNENLALAGTTVRSTAFAAGLTEEAEQAWPAVAEALRRDDLAVPRASQLGVDTETLRAYARVGRLVLVADDLAYLPDQLDTVEAAVETLPGGFTVAQFRDQLGVTRRHAVPLLEWLDGRRVTERRGDRRWRRTDLSDERGSGGAPTR